MFRLSYTRIHSNDVPESYPARASLNFALPGSPENFSANLDCPDVHRDLVIEGAERSTDRALLRKGAKRDLPVSEIV